MKIITKIRAVMTVAAMTLLALPVSGQDLLARQAPIDKRLRAVDSLSLIRMIGEEQLENPAGNLYPTWNNVYTNNFGVNKPKEYRIDLRHFCMPCDSRNVTSSYGYRRSFRRNHYGTDIKVYVGDTIRAAFSGKVRIVADQGYRKGYGKYIIIRHNNGLETVYGHLSKQLVREDQVVKAGDVIALGGNTGRSTGSHLHFETRFLGEFINPELLFNFAAQDVKADYYLFRPNGRGQLLASTVNPEDGDDMEPGTEPEDDEMLAQAEPEPQKPAKQEKKATSKIHKVKSGDTLSSIAKKYHTTIDKLCKLNHISRNSTLRLGQIIKYS